jgi:hypothetical protein
MKEERGILRDIIDTAKPKEGGKTKKYVRMAIACIGIGLILLVIVMAALRRYGS